MRLQRSKIISEEASEEVEDTSEIKMTILEYVRN